MNLEAGISVANGSSGQNSNLTNSLFNRASTVGLMGEFGVVKAGLELNPMLATYASVLPMSAESVYATTSEAMGFGNFYTPNSLTYYSPTVDGFNVAAQYSFGGVAGSASANNTEAFALVYTVEGLHVGGAYSHRTWNSVNNFGAANNGYPYILNLISPNQAGSQTTYLIGGNLTFGKFKSALSYVHNDISGFATGGDAKVGAYMVGGSYKFTEAIEAGASYIGNNHQSSLSTIQAHYAFSPRTMIYALVDFTKNGNNTTGNSAALANFGTINPLGALPVTGAIINNSSYSGLATGMVHRF